MLENNTNRLALGAIATLVFILGFTAILAYQPQWQANVDNYRQEHKMVE